MSLGIDLGTSAVKVVLIDAARHVVTSETHALAVSRPRPLWSEQEPEDWWRATEAAVAAIRSRVPEAFARIAAIGLSGQMHAALILGADDRPLRPAILWNDGRAVTEAAELHARYPHLSDLVGVQPMPGFTLPKLLWLKRHEPDVFGQIRTILLPKDYLRLKLTGDRVTDCSDAAGTWGLDEANRTWSPEAVAAVGLEASALPRLVEGTEVSGLLRAEIATAWGLSRHVIVAGGAGDAAAGALGIGAIAPGDSFVSLGTSCQLVRIGDAYRPNVPSLVHAFAHAVPGRWYQMGAMLSGASAFGWTAGLLGQDVDALSDAIAATYVAPSPVIALPYLTGERTPHNNPNAKAVFFGMTSATTQVDVAQAVMEAVAFTLADAQAALGRDATSDRPMGAVGGGARSAVWMRIIASVLDRPIARYRDADKGPAFGAALLARIAATGEAVADVALAPVIEDIAAPDARLVQAYRERLAKFRRLYQAVKAEF
jgi:xylulokinase